MKESKKIMKNMSRDGSYLSMDTLGGIDEEEEYKEEDSSLATNNNIANYNISKRSHLTVEQTTENK